MHSRIKEIADKVWSLDTEPNPHFEICLQAFAELLINECAYIAWMEDHEPSECILNHFGIEDELKS